MSQVKGTIYWVILALLGGVMAVTIITLKSVEKERTQIANTHSIAQKSPDHDILTPSGWLKYQNQKIGLSFQYPPAFSLTEGTGTSLRRWNGHLVRLVYLEKVESEWDRSTISFDFYKPDSPYTDLADAISRDFSIRRPGTPHPPVKKDAGGWGISEFKYVVVDNREGIYQEQSDEAGETTQVFIPLDDTTILILWGRTDSNWIDSFKDTFDKIMGTITIKFNPSAE